MLSHLKYVCLGNYKPLHLSQINESSMLEELDHQVMKECDHIQNLQWHSAPGKEALAVNEKLNRFEDPCISSSL